MPSFYPIHISVEGKRCVVVGGGKTAERKVSTLLRYGGKVVVVSPQATLKIAHLAQQKRVVWHKREYRTFDLNRAFLVFCATDSEKLNREVSNGAKKRGILVNVVDSLKDCSFISPALMERGHLRVSIATDGLAPLLSRRIREELETYYGKEYRQYTRLIAQVRSAILKDKRLDRRSKRESLDRLLSLNIIDRLKRGEKIFYRSVLKQLG